MKLQKVLVSVDNSSYMSELVKRVTMFAKETDPS